MSKIIIDNMIIEGDNIRMVKMNSDVETNMPKLRRVESSELSDVSSLLLCKPEDTYMPCVVVSVHPEDSKVLVDVSGRKLLLSDTEIWTVQ